MMRGIKRLFARLIEGQWHFGSLFTVKLYRLLQRLTRFLFWEWKQMSLLSARLAAWLRRNGDD